jgi:hypothetical protein
MPFGFNRTPFPAVADLAVMGGLGKYRQQQFDNDLRSQALGLQAQQQDFQQQANQQQMAMRAWDQQNDHAYRQQYLQQQLQQQQMANERQMFRDTIGFYGDQMHDISVLEKQGYQYSPKQQADITALDEDRYSAMTDDAVGPRERAAVEQQYWSKRARIRPSAPPPKPRQEVFEESLVSYKFPDGTEVVGTMGERNGVPTFDAIENPAKKDAVLEQKAALEQHKFEATQAINEKKIEQQIQKMQLDAMQFEMKAQQQQVSAQEKFKQTQLNNFNSAYLKHLTQLNSLKPPKKDEISGETVGEPIEVQQRRLRDGFKNVYGKMMLEVAPDIAAEYGLEAPPQQQQQQQQSSPMMDESAFFQGQSQQQTTPPQQDHIPTITSPEVAANLPSGYRFIGPDGKVHKVP